MCFFCVFVFFVFFVFVFFAMCESERVLGAEMQLEEKSGARSEEETEGNTTRREK